jgi:hypothetical protein
VSCLGFVRFFPLQPLGEDPNRWKGVVLGLLKWVGIPHHPKLK